MDDCGDKIALIIEGTNDKRQIQKALSETPHDIVRYIVTGGTKVNNRIKNEIESCMSDGYEVYVFSDPDIAGEQLSEMIKYWFPEIKEINADINECAYFTGKKFKAGIEYASYDYLKRTIYPLIGMVYTPKENPICWD